MKDNIIHLFNDRYVALRNFTRLIVSNTCIKMQHIENASIIFDMTVNIDESSVILYRLKNLKGWPIELVLNSSSISCKCQTYSSISFNKKITLSPYTKRATNATLYNEYNGFINVCDIYLNNKQIKFLDTVQSLQNSIVCITSWPSWVVSNYFENFIEDKGIFNYAIFILDRNQYYETICYSNNDYILLYRRDAIDNDCHKKIVENIIESLLCTHNITIDDIAIYVINDNVINNFVTQVAIDMQFSKELLQQKSS